MVEADLGVGDADGVEHTGHAERGGLPGQDRLGPRGLHEGLGGEVVDLGRPVLAQDADERDLVEQVAGTSVIAVLDVGDALEVRASTTAAPCR